MTGRPHRTDPIGKDDACAVASTLADCLVAGRISDVVAMMDPDLTAKHDVGAILTRGWQHTVDGHGPVTGLEHPIAEVPRADGSRVVTIVVRAEQQPFQIRVTVGSAGRVTSLYQNGPNLWITPEYASPSVFTESEMTIGPAGLAVAATLCLPRGRAPAAGVVLLPGSGPTDRDSTIGPNKPFKDLAWGLATRGIATLRFNKVTHTHPATVAAQSSFTVADEYLTHAAAAITLLAHHPAIQSHRIFLLGHSQGATIAPRIALHRPELAGLICLAAGAQPIHHAAIRQLQYLAKINTPPTTAIEQMLITLIRQAATVDDENLSESTPASDLPFGVPAAYWLDLRAHEPLSTAIRLQLPMLFLQGGRDYQVTTEDLRAWQRALMGRPNVRTRIYPECDHYFFTGTQASTPASYHEPQHVDPQVINDIADWIAQTAPYCR